MRVSVVVEMKAPETKGVGGRLRDEGRERSLEKKLKLQKEASKLP